MDESKIKRSSMVIVILLGLLQGVFLLYGHELYYRKLWPVQDFTGVLIWFSLGTALPFIIQVMVSHIKTVGLWIFVSVFGFMMTLFALYTGHVIGAPGGIFSILFSYSLTITVVLILSIGFVRAWLSSKRLLVPYSIWITHVWDVFLIFFAGIWFMFANGFFLWLFGKFLYFYGLNFSVNISIKSIYFLPLFCVIFSVAISLFQFHDWFLVSLRNNFWKLFLKCLPAVMVLTFLVSFLLFLDDWVTFWNGENTIAWTLFFQMFVVMVLNGVFPDGQFSAIQSKWLALALRATVLILPLHTILYGIFLYGKFQSTGWTVGLFWEIFLAGVVGLCVLGYALSSFYPLEKWMNGIGAVNVGAGALVIILLGLVNTPFLDPKPMTISSQVKRLMSNEIHPDVFNYYNLGMRLGKLGQSHLAQLTHLEEHPNAQLIRKNAVNSISNMGCHNKPDFLSTPVKPKKPERGKIYLIPLDEEAKLIVSKMIPYYQKNYSLTVHSLSNHSGIDEDDLYNMILNWDRNQLIAEEMIGALKRLFPNLAQDPNAILIGITSDDMYIRKYRWRFAFAYRDANRFAIISTARMEPLWYGTTEDPIIFHQRARKMVSRYIGFMYYGLNTNNDKHSVLCNSIGGIEDLDTIGEWF